MTVPANSTALAEFTGFDLPVGASKGKVKIEAEDPLLSTTNSCSRSNAGKN